MKTNIVIIKDGAFIAISLDEPMLGKVFQTGRLKSLQELSEEEQKEASKSKNGIDYYLRTKAQVERWLNIDAAGTLEDPYAISACLCTKNGYDERTGGAEQYGDIYFVLDKERIKSRVVFTEGDTMNYIRGLIRPLEGKRLNYEKEEEIHQKRQLSFDHALISKAIYEIFYSFGGSRDTVDYIEASIGGVKLEDIESICYPKEYEDKIKKYKEKYSQYAYLFKAI